MDWTSWAGRKGPVELEALRLLVLVHRLGGEPAAPTAADSDSFADDQIVRVLRGERSVQALDHLLAHPATLAYVLMDAFLEGRDDLSVQRGALARRVRWLLANDRRHFDPNRRGRYRRRGQNVAERVDAGRMHRFRPFVWRRWDDVLGTLQTRGLMRVDAEADPASVRYGLTSTAATWLEAEVYGSHGDSDFHAQVCTVVDDFLPDRDDVPERLAPAGERHCAFRRDHGLTAGDDAASPRFHATFRERL